MAINPRRNPKTVKKGDRTGRPRGRPVGSVTVRTRRMAQEILKDGDVTPLEVMVQNMRFFHHQSVKIVEEIQSRMGRKGTDLEELTDLLRKLMHSRERAQACAVDAAPYLHPKLQSITLKNEGEEDEDGGVFRIEFVKAKPNADNSNSGGV